MNVAWIVAAALGLGTAAWVIAPLLRSDAAEAERVARVVSERAELLSRKEQLLIALRDLEDDRETGKISARDHADLETRLTAETADVLRRLDALEDASRQESVREHPSAVQRS